MGEFVQLWNTMPASGRKWLLPAAKQVLDRNRTSRPEMPGARDRSSTDTPGIPIIGSADAPTVLAPLPPDLNDALQELIARFGEISLPSEDWGPIPNTWTPGTSGGGGSGLRGGGSGGEGGDRPTSEGQESSFQVTCPNPSCGITITGTLKVGTKT